MNTWKTRGLCLLLTGSMLVSGLGLQVLAADGTAPTAKEETVFVVAGADGTAREIIVSDWLQNGDGANRLQDSSDLRDIQVVQGQAEQVEGGNGLAWETGGADVYYQGSAQKELPVGVEFSYELDGKKITPEELAGKSGKLKITITYHNDTEEAVTVDGKTETMTAPFLMVTGLVLSGETCKNVTVDHGTVETDGDRLMVLGYGLPGLSESLKLSEPETEDREAPEIPETVEITAEVTDFDLELAVTVASCGLLEGLELTGNETREELEDALKDLEDATGKLMDGTQELLEGTEDLTAGTGELRDGAVQLDDGVGELATGGDTLYTGAGTLDTGAGSLQVGVSSLQGGIAQIQQALTALDRNSATLTQGSAAVKQALLQIQGALQGVSTSTDALAALTDGSGAVLAGLKSLKDGAAALQQGVSYGAYTQLLQSYGMDLAALQAGNDQAITALDNMIALLDGQLAAGGAGGTTGNGNTGSGTAGSTGGTTGNTGTKNGTSAAQAAPGADAAAEETAGEPAETEEMPDTVPDVAVEDTPAAEQAVPSVPAEAALPAPQAEAPQAEATGNTGAEYRLQMLDDGQNPLSQLAAMREQLVQLRGLLVKNNAAIAGTDQVANAYLTGANYQLARLLEGATTLETEYGKLHQGILTLAGTLTGLSDSMGQLSAGIDQLVTQYTALDQGTQDYTGAVGQILAGHSRVVAGAQALREGTDTLKSGTAKLYSGAGTLVSGIGTLREGTGSLREGTVELDDGAKKLQDGAKELRDGMQEYREDGIDRLLDLYWDNVPKLIERLTALQELGRTHSSFSGAPEGVDSSVRYVIRTEMNDETE